MRGGGARLPHADVTERLGEAPSTLRRGEPSAIPGRSVFVASRR
jgi:hypothetical protein